MHEVGVLIDLTADEQGAEDVLRPRTYHSRIPQLPPTLKKLPVAGGLAVLGLDTRRHQTEEMTRTVVFAATKWHVQGRRVLHQVWAHHSEW